MAIVIMLNNLLHDFAVALLCASLLVLLYIYREVNPHRDSPSLSLEHRIEFARRLVRVFNKVTVGCWIVILLGGVVRTLAFEQFEWSEAAGRGQVGALVVKHILLVALVVWGTVIQLRLKKVLKKELA